MPSANEHFQFDFVFALNLGQRLFSPTDNLSRAVQRTKMSALSGKRVACLTKDILQKMRDDANFRSFYDVVLIKSKSYIPPRQDRCYKFAGQINPKSLSVWKKLSNDGVNISVLTAQMEILQVLELFAF